ncbi:MAG: hypothetical protein ACP5HP_00535 [Thermogladius sp.]
MREVRGELEILDLTRILDILASNNPGLRSEVDRVKEMYDRLSRLQLYVLNREVSFGAYLLLYRVMQLAYAVEKGFDSITVASLLRDLGNTLEETYARALRSSRLQRLQFAAPVVLSSIAFLLCYASSGLFVPLLSFILGAIAVPLFALSAASSYLLDILGGLWGLSTSFEQGYDALTITLYTLIVVTNATYLVLFEVARSVGGAFPRLVSSYTLVKEYLVFVDAGSVEVDEEVLKLFARNYGEIGKDLLLYKINALRATGFSSDEITRRIRALLDSYKE